jgi:hypothetical protein
MRVVRKCWRRRLAVSLTLGMVMANSHLSAQGKAPAQVLPGSVVPAVVPARQVPMDLVPVAPVPIQKNADAAPVDDRDRAVDLSLESNWDEDEVTPVPVPGSEVQIRQVGVPGRRVMISISIDHWVFGTERTNGVDLLNSFLTQKLAAIKREYEELNDQQIAKLMLAGRGDIKHFHDQVAVLKAKYPQNRIDQETLHVVLSEVQTLRRQLQSDQFFGAESLLTKALNAVIIKQQLKPKYVPKTLGAANPGAAGNVREFRIVVRQDPQLAMQPELVVVSRPVQIVYPQLPVQLRDDAYYATLIRLISESFDPETPFREEQKEPLTRMLHKASIKSPIPLRDLDVAMSHLAELPENEYRDILDPEQLNCLRHEFAAVKVRLQKKAEEAVPLSK